MNFLPGTYFYTYSLMILHLLYKHSKFVCSITRCKEFLQRVIPFYQASDSDQLIYRYPLRARTGQIIIWLAQEEAAEGKVAQPRPAESGECVVGRADNWLAMQIERSVEYPADAGARLELFQYLVVAGVRCPVKDLRAHGMIRSMHRRSHFHPGARRGMEGEYQDRKSTRLNS